MLAAALLALAPSTALVTPVHYETDAFGHPLNCNAGGVFKDFGGQRWKVLACEDGRSLAFKAVQPAGAKLCVVYLWAERSRYSFDGSLCEAGKAQFAAGIAEVKRLSPQQASALAGETRAAAHGKT